MLRRTGQVVSLQANENEVIGWGLLAWPANPNARGNGALATGALEHQLPRRQGFILRAARYQCHVRARNRKNTADVTADRAGAENQNLHC